MIQEAGLELFIGHAAIDEQHERIFQLLEQTRQAVLERRGHGAIGKLLSAISVFVIAHFRLEEALMEKAGYPGRAAHIADHDSVRSRVEAFVDEYYAGKLRPEDFSAFLHAWVNGHITRYDAPMAEFLNQVRAGTDQTSCAPPRAKRTGRGGGRNDSRDGRTSFLPAAPNRLPEGSFRSRDCARPNTPILLEAHR